MGSRDQVHMLNRQLQIIQNLDRHIAPSERELAIGDMINYLENRDYLGRPMYGVEVSDAEVHAVAFGRRHTETFAEWRRTARCRYCGQLGLSWRLVDGGWRLHDGSEKHVCDEYKSSK